MDMIVAAGGGERDYAVDPAILSALPSAAGSGRVPERAPSVGPAARRCSWRSLSNLLAGNISIVHGVVGSSRTFMGEEASGADAVRIACARIAAGQGDLFLVGGSYNAQRPDVAAALRNGRVAVEAAVRRRLGASGARRRHGAGVARLLPGDRKPRARRRRAARRLAHIASIATDRCRRRPGEATANATDAAYDDAPSPEPPYAAVISGASGVAAPTARGG